MVKILIIADDFTGALDTGVQCAKNSINTMVVLYKELDFSKIDESIQAVVVDTESRHVIKEEAALRVKEAATKAVKSNVLFFYKKTDSALRGNIGSELQAIMEGLNLKVIMFIPAFPDAKRTTVNGRQLVDGVPIAASAFANDPIDPVKESYIPSIIKSQAEIDVEVVGREQRETTYFESKGKNTVYVFDAERNNDLKEIALLLKEKRKLRLTSGCAGFAKMLLEALDLKANKKRRFLNLSGKMLTVCGSLNDSSLKQIKYAQDHGFLSITLSPEEKLKSGFFKTGKGQAFIKEISERYEEGQDLIIKTVDSAADEAQCREYARSLKIKESEIPFVVSQNIGRLVSEIAKAAKLETLVVFGGDTIASIAKEMEFDGVVPIEEIMTGVVLSETHCKGMKINLVTKAGGFGSDNVLTKIKEYRCF